MNPFFSKIGATMLLGFLGLLCRVSAADNLVLVSQLQQTLESRASVIIKAFDPQALVLVKIYQKKHAAPLPMTPFVVRDLNLQDAEHSFIIDKVVIHVFSAQTDLPPTVTGLLKELLTGYGPVTVKLRALPTPEIPQLAKKEEPKKVAALVPPVVEKPALAAWEKINPALLVPIALSAMGVLFLVAGVLVGLILLRNSRALRKTVDHSTAKLTEAFEGGRGGERESAEPRALATALGTPVEAGPSGNVFAQMALESLAALLSDCYWGEYDAYACYIWKRIPYGVRTALVQSNDYLGNYASTFLKATEDNYAAEQEPCYLNPLAITHLDNKVMTQLVQDFPILLYQLSSLRVAKLQLRATDRLALTRVALKSTVGSLPDFTKMPPSPSRSLHRTLVIPLADVIEEREVLQSDDSLDAMESMQSLGWLARLPQEQIASILQDYTARELASAWIGPADVLQKLESGLPANKKKLLHSTLLRVVPSRRSVTYTQIYFQSLKALRAQALPLETDRVREQAA